MIIATVVNQAAKSLVNDFLAPSICKHAPKADFRLIEIDDDQEHKFGTSGAKQFYVRIAEEILQMHEDPRNDGELILSLGGDTQLLEMVDFEAALGDADLLTMHDVFTPICGCVIGMRASKRAADFYRVAIGLNDNYSHMQYAQAKAAQMMNLKLAYIPKAWTTGYVMPDVWKFDQPIQPPRGTTLHHANFVIGMDRKRQIMVDALTFSQVSKE
jgi:hypothetical protein